MVRIGHLTYSHGSSAQEGQGQAQGDFQEIREEHFTWTSAQAAMHGERYQQQRGDLTGYVQQSVRLQNEIISGMIMDIDNLRGMILNIHKEQEYIKRVFLKPQPPLVPPPEFKRPVSVPTKTRLPNIVPRPPTRQRPQSHGRPRKLVTRPVVMI